MIENGQYIISKRGILELSSFNIALLDKCISQYTKHPVLALGSIRQYIAPREYMVKYCPPREGYTENQLFQYHPTSESNTKNNCNASLKLYTLRIRTRQGIYGQHSSLQIALAPGRHFHSTLAPTNLLLAIFSKLPLDGAVVHANFFTKILWSSLLRATLVSALATIKKHGLIQHKSKNYFRLFLKIPSSRWGPDTTFQSRFEHFSLEVV